METLTNLTGVGEVLLTEPSAVVAPPRHRDLFGRREILSPQVEEAGHVAAASVIFSASVARATNAGRRSEDPPWVPATVEIKEPEGWRVLALLTAAAGMATQAIFHGAAGVADIMRGARVDAPGLAGDEVAALSWLRSGLFAFAVAIALAVLAFNVSKARRWATLLALGVEGILLAITAAVLWGSPIGFLVLSLLPLTVLICLVLGLRVADDVPEDEPSDW